MLSCLRLNNKVGSISVQWDIAKSSSMVCSEARKRKELDHSITLNAGT
ncbi:hypothetical protein CGRA01v4_12351 [Colletotrichum graminicola]|nr:hypothetical protein CGRA01v4_12351 [Colletotrichum graminicola]